MANTAGDTPIARCLASATHASHARDGAIFDALLAAGARLEGETEQAGGGGPAAAAGGNKAAERGAADSGAPLHPLFAICQVGMTTGADT